MPLCLTRADFTITTPPQSERERVNLLICNPPYVRHHHLVNGEKLHQKVTATKGRVARLLAAAGVTDLSRYAVKPGSPLLPDLFLD
jgi:methylase of polypeptide subunit release factors